MRNDINKRVLNWRFTLVLNFYFYVKLNKIFALFISQALVSGKKNISRYWYI
jgi:hypothetical protein